MTQDRGDTIFGYHATLTLNVDGVRVTPARPFIYDDGIRLDVTRIAELVNDIWKERRADLLGVRTKDGRVYAPEDIEFVYEADPPAPPRKERD